jgi:glycine cleavage system aminomethyltransferase T
MRGGRPVGHTLDSLYSPALRQAIALGVLDTDAPAAGLTVNGISCRTCALPFL